MSEIYKVYTIDYVDGIIHELKEELQRLTNFVATQEAIITNHDDRLSNIEGYLLKIVEEEAEGKKQTPWQKYKETKKNGT